MPVNLGGLATHPCTSPSPAQAFHGVLLHAAFYNGKDVLSYGVPDHYYWSVVTCTFCCFSEKLAWYLSDR